MSKHLFYIIILLASSCITSACWYPKNLQTKNALFTPSGSFRKTDETIAIMQKLPLAERYDIYIEGMYRSHPPDFRLANGILPLGASAIDFLKGKLKLKTGTISDKIFTIDLLGWMAYTGCYDVKSDASLMKVINETQNDLIAINPNLYKIFSNESDSFNNYEKMRSYFEKHENARCHL